MKGIPLSIEHCLHPTFQRKKNQDLKIDFELFKGFKRHEKDLGSPDIIGLLFISTKSY